MSVPTGPRRPWRPGGWTVLVILAVSCWLCGFASALFV